MGWIGKSEQTDSWRIWRDALPILVNQVHPSSLPPQPTGNPSGSTCAPSSRGRNWFADMLPATDSRHDGDLRVLT